MYSPLKPDLLAPKDLQTAKKILRSCVHCGFCLPTCPTYELLGNELESPRGRIYLIKQALEGHTVTQKSLGHLDRCLGCRACETACPSGVNYTQLLDIGRGFINKNVKRSVWQRGLRYSVRKILTTPKLFNTLVTVFPWLKHSAITDSEPLPCPKAGSKKIVLLSGCVQPALAPNINHSIQKILTQLDYEVIETPQIQCCGGLDQHLNAPNDALIKIKTNIDSWTQNLQQGAEAIISSASGCGIMIKDYPHLMRDDVLYYEKAKKIAAKTVDISEFLSHQDLSVFNRKNSANFPKKLSFHAPCTLQHGLGITGVVEKILVDLGYQLNSIKEAHLCCGSAGTYSIFQPKLSHELRKNKLKDLMHDQPELIVTANIGCLVHLQKTSPVHIKHWVELLTDVPPII
ncbi:MAG: glycolate oxidase subunit GlcF [Methylococcales bacterium]|nr:glycolate oxidase subunit GlcF [Methylococcales bacterium]